MSAAIPVGLQLNADGDLDLTSVSIVTTSDGDVEVVPNGTGSVRISKPVTASTYKSLLKIADTGSAASTETGIDWRNTSNDWDQARISILRRASANDFHLVIYTSEAGVITEKVRIQHDGNVGFGVPAPPFKITSGAEIGMLERSSDPTEPTEGQSVIWMSDGTGKGDDGDVMIASQADGTTNYGTLFDHSAGAAW